MKPYFPPGSLPHAHRIATARYALSLASQARGDDCDICDEAVVDLLADPLRQYSEFIAIIGIRPTQTSGQAHARAL